MQNAGINALGLNWRYLAFDVYPQDLASAIAGAKAMKFIGLNLTVPHKLLALELVDVLDDSGLKWGAVNTIRFETQTPEGNWLPLAQVQPDATGPIRAAGYNTDADAIIRSLREDLAFEPRGSSILLLGAGGAGRVAALRLAQEGPSAIYLVNRTRAKAEELASAIKSHSRGVEVTIGFPRKPVDLVLNATSLGLKENDPLPFDQAQWSLQGCGAVYDMIYRPAETTLLQLARRSGCRTANGLGMLLYQGAKALEIWSGQKAPVEIMRRALEQNVYGK
jgi:shikimate dehydrogenase